MNEKGLSLDAQDNHGNSPMHNAVAFAAKEGYTRSIRTLLFNSAPKDLLDKNNKTPLDLAMGVEDEGIKKNILKLLDNK